MKTCPVCHAKCFDDMEVCYGCLHRFADEGEGKAQAQARNQEDKTVDAGAGLETQQNQNSGSKATAIQSASVPAQTQVFAVGADRCGDAPGEGAPEGFRAAGAPLTIEVLSGGVAGAPCAEQVRSNNTATQNVPSQNERALCEGTARIQLVINLRPVAYRTETVPAASTKEA